MSKVSKLESVGENLRKNNKVVLLAAVFGFATIGVIYVLTSMASTGTMSLEVEGGTITSPAQKISDSGASGSQAIKFATPAVQPPSEGALWQIPNPALPTVETVAYSGMSGDISDDMALYSNPTDPAKSVVVGANKAKSGGGVAVFDMQGKMLQFRKDGYIANIDLRTFRLGGRDVVLLGANNRTSSTIDFWELNPSTRQLSAKINARTISTSTGAANYGFCFYQSAKSGKLYAFVTPNGSGSVQQWEVVDNGGKVDAKVVRSLPISSITESCVADDELGYVYINQEDVATWKYNAEPDGGTSRTQITKVGDGKVVADLEGISIAYGPNKTGYIVMSIQGKSQYVLYDRQTNAYIRTFSVGSNGTIDAASGTDGLDITVKNMGPGFEKGVLVVHDEANSGGGTSNLKYVPLR